MCMCFCVTVYLFVSVCVCLHMHVYMYVPVYVSVSVYMCPRVLVHVQACVLTMACGGRSENDLFAWVPGVKLRSANPRELR